MIKEPQIPLMQDIVVEAPDREQNKQENIILNAQEENIVRGEEAEELEDTRVMIMN